MPAVRRRPTRVIVAILTLAALIGLLFLYKSSHWWDNGKVSFGGEVGRFRVDSGEPGTLGAGSGLAGPAPPLSVHVGSTIDIMLDGSWGPVVSSNPNVVGKAQPFWGSFTSSVQFDAFAVGTAELTTTAKAADCGGVMPSGPGSSTRCGVLSITVEP